ncbi:MAG: VWA domain-containing protein [Chitinophagaceae bacterium]|nr:VWA domain-containing protein [Chitinophagaceae bacterium]
MALDEFLFGKIVHFLQKRKMNVIQKNEKVVILNDIKQRLTILARALSGQSIEIYPAEREGGYKNNSYFFPASFSMFESFEQNLSYYYFRLLYLTVQQEHNLNWFEPSDLEVIQARQKAEETSISVLAKLFIDYPLAKKWFENFEYQLRQQTPEGKMIDRSWLFGKWMRCERESKDENTLQHFSQEVKKSMEEAAQTVLMTKAVEEIITVEVDKKQQEDYVMTHNFEKVETADEHSGIWRDFDGENELEEHQQALDELNMKFVVRVDDTAHSVYHAEFIENTSISESATHASNDFHFSYDEWNFAKNEYRKNFCQVYPSLAVKSESTYYENTIQKNQTTLNGLRKMLTSVNNKRQQVRRQSEGDEFDIDALNDLYMDLANRHTPDEKVYLSRRKKEKDISILLLMDISLSSDGYADGNRVIDVEKQVSILFGEILQENHIDFSVHGFYSKTRNYLSYVSMKNFEDDWSVSKHRIGSIEPSGYTRIGAALRHSGFILGQRQAKNKWVILLSDGKPNDYDKYEGKYGIQDVKQALYELKTQNINSYALAIESQARYYLPQMFGQNHYQILTTPNGLLTSLVKLYEKIKH